MPRRPRIPEPLTHAPFTVAEALTAGLTRRQLAGSTWERIGRGRYVFARLPRTIELRLGSLLDSLPPGSVLAGRTAAHLFGIAAAADSLPEVVVPPRSGRSTNADAVIREARLDPDDVARRRGLPVTAPLRTCFDLAARLSLVEATVMVDAALHARLVGLDALRRYVADHRGRPGVRRARQVLDVVEPASESPMETRLRMLLIQVGLPRPQAQVEIRDDRGAFVGRLDLCYPEAHLGIEYDGATHQGSLTADNRRQNRLTQAGITLLRYTAPDIYERPHVVAAEVRAALAKGPIQANGTFHRSV